MKTPILASLLLAALVVCPGTGRAQTLVGLVFDAATEAPVEGAAVTLMNASDEAVRSAITDGAGSFVLEAPAPGEFRIRVSRLGYQTYRSNSLALTSGITTQVRVLMGVNAIPIDPLTVLTEARAASGPLIGFERRMEDPSLAGFYVTREEIDRRPSATPTQLLLAAPGVTLQRIETPDQPGWQDRSMVYLNGARGSAARPGGCLAQVFVNGARMPQTTSSSLDDILDTNLLEGVEVYPRAAFAPPEYRGSGECGVVLFWLRETQPSERGWGLKRILVGASTIAGLVLWGFIR